MNTKAAWVTGVLLAAWCNAALAQSVPESWRACEKDSQCTAVKSMCGETWLPVSKAHEANLEAFVADMRKVAKCAPAKAPAAPNMKCMNSLCADDVTVGNAAPSAVPATVQKGSL